MDLDQICTALKKVEEAQTRYETDFLNKSATGAAPAVDFTDAVGQQQQELSALSQAVTSIQNAVSNLMKKADDNERKLDDLEQYGRANCLILHGCKKVPLPEAKYPKFQKYVIDTINEKISLSAPLISTDIDICHPLNNKK